MERLQKVMKKVGFIGCGKMASAIIKGCISSNLFDKSDILASEINEQARVLAQKQFDIEILDNNLAVVKNSEVIVLCVKPFVIKDVLKEISSYITKEKLIISIAAGVKIKTIKEFLPVANVIRVMPNTPAMIKEGISAICVDENVDENSKKIAQNIMSSVGETVFADEKDIDIITSLSGSGPAFYYKIINDMACSAQKMGLDYDMALKLSAQTAVGAAKMLIQSGIDAQTLIKNVTTPGGCTEVGNKVLADKNIEAILDETIKATAQKAKELG